MSAQSSLLTVPMQDQGLYNAPFPAWAKTIDGTYLEANPAAVALIGREIVGRTTEQLFGDQAHETREAEAAALALGVDQRYQLIGDTVVLVVRWTEDGLIRGIAIRR